MSVDECTCKCTCGYEEAQRTCTYCGEEFQTQRSASLHELRCPNKTGKKYADVEWLITKYWDEKLSCQKMANECECTSETIRYWMERYSIPRRNYGPLTGEQQ